MILGVDTSHYDPQPDWKELANNGVAWMYTKASQGANFTDSSLPQMLEGASEAGVITGAYHFFMANISDKYQISCFFNGLQGKRPGLPHILDWENGSVQGIAPDVQIARAGLILDAMEEHLKKDQARTTPEMTTPWIYMGLDMVLELKLPESFSRYPLIVADYSIKTDELPVMSPWGKPTAHQFTDSEHLMGLSPGYTIDANWFLGSLLDLKAYCPQT